MPNRPASPFATSAATVSSCSGGVRKTPIISQDQQRKLQQEVQHLTDDYIKRIDEALAQKDKEILQV